jgi:tRNA nucleotidyltransferase (CCA-adding enzyme)
METILSTPTLSLTELEHQVFGLLLQVAQEKAPHLTIRAAGGWVRDKLMGRVSHDIDITVDHMSGYEFARMVMHWMRERDLLSTETEVAKVEANPEQSKHLETAILPIFGIPVDFVQLRRETYDSTRIPSIETQGITAAEDALRRDFTINALFYNLHTGLVEDYVNGVADLEQKFLRSPIDPLKTFLQDPLRMLRAIRFAAKYQFTLDPELVEAAQHPQVQTAFQTKVTRERVWTELVGQQEQDGWKLGLLTGPNFHLGAELLHTLGLRDLILRPSWEQLQRSLSKQSEDEPKWQWGFFTWDMDQNNPHHNLTVWRHTMAALAYLQQEDLTELSVGDRMVRNLAMLLHDMGKCDLCSRQTDPATGYSTYHGHELSSALAADELLLDLKAPTDVRQRVVKLVRNHMRLHVLPSNVSGAALRRVVRDVGEDWPLLVAMSKADAMGKASVENLDPKYEEFDRQVKEFLSQTGGKSEMPMPLNGKEIMAALQLSPGPKVGVVTRALKERLLDHPEMTKDEALEFIQTVPLTEPATSA